MEIKNGTKFKRLTSVSDLSCDSGTEYTLPDYQGDVRRILFTRCEAKPSGKFSDGDTDEFSGSVEYEVIYLDSDSRLTHTSFSSDYDLVNKRLGGDGGDAFANPTVSTYSIRLTGPRRFSAKAIVCASVKSTGEDEVVAVGGGFDQESEIKNRMLAVRGVIGSENLEREYAERIERLDGIIADEVEVLYSGSEVRVGGMECSDGAVTFKGEIRLYALMLVGDSPLYCAERVVPFEELIPFADAENEMMLIPRATVQSVTSTVTADDTGCEVVLNAVVEFAAEAEYNQSVIAVSDAYVVNGECENTYSDYRYISLCDSVGISDPMTVTLNGGELVSDSLRDIPFIEVTPRLESAAPGDGGVVLSGELKIIGIASVVDEEGRITYAQIKHTEPFERFVKCKVSDPEALRIEASIGSQTASAVIDGDQVRLAFNLCGNIITSASSCDQILATCNVSEEPAEKLDGKITVYYPTDGESLFSVGKRFKISTRRLSETNEIAVSASAGENDVPLGEIKSLLIY